MKPVILFVDDEPAILKGLRRTLRRQTDWTQHYAPGGPEAIELLSSIHVDIVVSDMRMPTVDGIAVLRHAAKTNPDSIRIVLSGNADLVKAIHSIQLAHQYIAKPCQPAELIALLTDLTDMIEVLRRTSALAATLPPCPSTYVEVTDALDSGQGLVQVGKILQKDPSVSALLLKVTNSAFLGMAQKVSSVSRAVQILGVRTIRDIVLCAGATDSFKDTPVDIEAFQRHAMSVATVSKALFPNAGAALLTSAFLHDIGSMVLALDDSGHLASHHTADVGGYLLGVWNLPLDVVDAVANRHRPGRKGVFGAPEQLHVADVLVHQLELGANIQFDQTTVSLVGDVTTVNGWKQAAEEALSGVPA